MGVERKGEIQSLVGCTKGRREWEPVEKYEMNHLLLLRVGRKKMVPGHRAGTDSDGDSFGGTVHKGHCRLLVQELSRKANLLSAAFPGWPALSQEDLHGPIPGAQLCLVRNLCRTVWV